MGKPLPRCRTRLPFLRASYSDLAGLSCDSSPLLFGKLVELDASNPDRTSHLTVRRLDTAVSGGHFGFTDRGRSASRQPDSDGRRAIRSAGLRDAHRVDSKDVWKGCDVRTRRLLRAAKLVVRKKRGWLGRHDRSDRSTRKSFCSDRRILSRPGCWRIGWWNRAEPFTVRTHRGSRHRDLWP